MFRLFGIMLVGFVLSGCASPSAMIEQGEIRIGMSKQDFESKMFWRADVWDDPGMEDYGASGYSPNFYGYTLVYGGNRDKFYVFDNKSILVAITEKIDEAEQIVLTTLRSGSQNQKSPLKVKKEQSANLTQAGLIAAQKESARLSRELANVKAQKEREQQAISNDNQSPLISVMSASTNHKRGVIVGKASDNVGIAEITISGQLVPFDATGNFQYQTFVPADGKNVIIEVADLAGLISKKVVALKRVAGLETFDITFGSLNPLGRRVTKTKDALALIIGVESYENTSAKAMYADSDAKMFADYGVEKLGIPANRVKTLIDDSADLADVLLSVREWLGRSVTQNKTDVYIFFSGHGLASDDGKKMYLLPHDGSPRLLDRTAILRDELFADISAANPRSVTAFLDTCYSGTTRGTDMLIASRPIAIRALEQSIPDNFTVMTAAAGDQTAKPLDEAKHGMFSYFLMKGMEGEADANNDNEITAGELHSYVQTNVIQQSSGSQTPELQGDADRVLVRFQ